MSEPINPFDLLDKIDEAAEVIADRYGMNVPYCESMAVSYFPQIIEATLTEDEKNELEELTPENDLLDTLRFYAWNNHFLPDSLKDASMEEFNSYLAAHKQEVYKEILDEIEHYCHECADETI